MARIHFTLGTRYLLNGQIYVIRQVLIEGQFQVENQHFGGLFVVAYSDLVMAWSRGELQFEIPARLARTTPDSSVGTEYTYADFQNLPQHLRDEAWRRYQLLLPLLKGQDKDRKRLAIKTYAASLLPTDAPRSKGKRGVMGEAKSWGSIERWLNGFLDSGCDIRSLVPDVERSARKGEVRIEADLETIVQAVLAECAAQRKQRTAYDVYLMIVDRVREENLTRPDEARLEPPSDTTVYRRIQQAGHLTILRRRLSRNEEQKDAPVEDGPKPTRVLERVEIDHTLLDLFVVDIEDRLPIGRPDLTFALDVMSGFPCGFTLSFEPASYLTTGECLLHGILPKPDVRTLYKTKNHWPVFGLMETLVVDNAKELVGRDLRDACAQLGIILEIMPVRTPWFKGSIERFFRTNNEGLVHTLPGTSFSNVLERGDYDALQHACISLPAFWRLLHVFLLDFYAQKWHEGVGGIPFKKWTQNVQSGFLPCLHTSAEETRILLMRTEDRTVQRAGIEFECLYYRSPDLARLRSLLPRDDKAVRFKYDPADISSIYVSDPINGRWLRVPAADQSYTQGLSLWKHRIIHKFVLAEKGEVDIEALAEAKAHMRRIVEEEFVLTRKKRGRKLAARFLNIDATPPPPPAAPTITIVVPATPPLPNPSQPLLPAPTVVADTNQQDVTPATPTTPSSGAAPRKRRSSRQTTSSSEPGSETALMQATTSNDEVFDTTGWGGDYDLPLK